MKSRLTRLSRSLLVWAVVVLFAALVASAQVPPSNWVRLTPARRPSARLACVMTYDPVSKKIVMFGGVGSTRYLNDTWTFDGTTWTRMKVKTAPSPRASASMAYDRKLRQLVLFGGYDGRAYLGDTWVWDGATSTWTPQAPTKTGPHSEAGAMLFTDPRTGRVDNFGGYDGRFYQGTTWQWKDGAWQDTQPAQHPGARAWAVFASDPEHKQTLVFGGLSDQNPVNTWTFDGRDWTQQFPSNQLSSRCCTGAVYDSRFHGIVVFGGFAGSDVNDTWLWTGSDWMQLNPTNSPSSREGYGIAFDKHHRQTVIFGGTSRGQLLHDTWVLQSDED